MSLSFNSNFKFNINSFFQSCWGVTKPFLSFRHTTWLSSLLFSIFLRGYFDQPWWILWWLGRECINSTKRWSKNGTLDSIENAIEFLSSYLSRSYIPNFIFNSECSLNDFPPLSGPSRFNSLMLSVLINRKLNLSFALSCLWNFWGK